MRSAPAEGTFAIHRLPPELDLPASFSRKEVEAWIARIRSARLRTLVAAAVSRALAHAEYEDARAGADTRS